VSIKNTRLWKTRKVDSAAVSKIEHALAEYCYGE